MIRPYYFYIVKIRWAAPPGGLGLSWPKPVALDRHRLARLGHAPEQGHPVVRLFPREHRGGAPPDDERPGEAGLPLPRGVDIDIDEVHRAPAGPEDHLIHLEVLAHALEDAAPAPLALPRLVDRRLQAALDVFADGLAVIAGTASDRRHAQPLPGKVQDHDKLPKGDHQPLP
jgi:hypothetical protein